MAERDRELRPPGCPSLPVSTSADPQSPQQPQKRKEPFTVSFVGLLSVLAGITIVATIGIPMWFGQPHITLGKAAKLLASDMETVREWAILAHKDCRIDFDPDGGGYAAFDSLGTPLPAPIGDGNLRRDYGVDAVFRGVTVHQLDLGGERFLTFDRRGLPRQDGSITLAYRGETRTVFLEKGRVRLQDN